MKKLVIPGLVLAVTLLAAPLAFAAEPPAAPTCGQALQDVAGFTGVTDAQKTLDQSNFPAQLKSLTDGPPGTPSLAVLQKAVADGIAADNKAVPPLTADSAATKAAKDALAARTAQIAAMQARFDAATKALADAKARLAVLVTVRDRVCAPPVPTTTPAPTATTTLAPTSTPAKELTCADYASMTPPLHNILRGDPRYRAALDSDGDGIGCELVEGTADVGNAPVVTAVPVGAVDTGWAL